MRHQLLFVALTAQPAAPAAAAVTPRSAMIATGKAAWWPGSVLLCSLPCCDVANRVAACQFGWLFLAEIPVANKRVLALIRRLRAAESLDCRLGFRTAGYTVYIWGNTRFIYGVMRLDGCVEHRWAIAGGWLKEEPRDNKSQQSAGGDKGFSSAITWRWRRRLAVSEDSTGVVWLVEHSCGRLVISRTLSELAHTSCADKHVVCSAWCGGGGAGGFVRSPWAAERREAGAATWGSRVFTAGRSARPFLCGWPDI